MVNSSGIIGFLLAIKFIEFFVVAPCDLVDYMSVVEENVIELHIITKCILIYVPFHCGLNEPF
jgi:hypothetical protein